MPGIPSEFLEELRARTPMAALAGRRVKLSRSGRNWKGCCPFHAERTPSFYVYDDGFHCFGCGAHGDAVSFVMQSEGTTFPEAVERLAREAGLEVPRRAETEVEHEARRSERGLLACLEDAASCFAQWLAEGRGGAAARALLDERGVGADAIAAWRLGWSGDGSALRPALGSKGYAASTLREAGLLSVGEDGAIRGEMFRNRVMFPISDRRGQVIGFGGRALGDAQPKYLNGPETAVFAKRAVLFGHARARVRLRETRAPGVARPKLVIAEGYMDVLALDAAGFAAVAPLGTAMTEEQLVTAWGLDPAPVLCLDGDAAGRRAATRAAERALPVLAAERTLLVASLAEGEDPDSLYRARGAAGLRAAVDDAAPLSVAIYDLLGPPGPEATPESRSAFRTRLVEAASAIGDRGLASEYRRALLDRWYADGRRRGGAGRPPSVRVPTRPALDEAQAREELACQLAVIAWRHPELRHDVEEAWLRVELPNWLRSLRDSILEGRLDKAEVADHLRPLGRRPDGSNSDGEGGTEGPERGLDRAIASITRRGGLAAAARSEAMPAEAEAGWWHFFGLLQHGRLDDEIRAAERGLVRNFTEAEVRRHAALIGARDELRTLANDSEP